MRCRGVSTGKLLLAAQSSNHRYLLTIDLTGPNRFMADRVSVTGGFGRAFQSSAMIHFQFWLSDCIFYNFPYHALVENIAKTKDCIVGSGKSVLRMESVYFFSPSDFKQRYEQLLLNHFKFKHYISNLDNFPYHALVSNNQKKKRERNVIIYKELLVVINQLINGENGELEPANSSKRAR